MEPVLYSAWQTTHPAGHTVRTHSHRDWELVYYFSGCGETHLGTAVHSFSAHTFALIRPGVPHDERHDAGGAVLCIEFSADAPLQTGLYPDRSDIIATLARRLRAETRDQLPEYRAMTVLKLRELLLELKRMDDEPTRPRKDLRYAMHVLEENYGRALPLRELAAECGYSYHYFYHRFRAMAGVSPQQYLLQIRLRAAAQLLRTTNDTCTEIALACGFYGSAQFSALFRRAYGCTPTAYRHSRTE